MEISRATEQDIPALLQLLSQVLEVHAKDRPDIFKAGSTKFSANDLQILMKDDTQPIFIARENDELIGHIFCKLEDFSSEENMQDIKSMHIEDLCVDINQRGKHIGESLMNFAFSFAKKQGCYNVTLNVWAQNSAAIGFYEKEGLSIQKYTMEKLL